MKKRAVKRFFTENYLPFLFALAAMIIETSAVLFTSGRPFIRSPWFHLTLLAFLTAPLFLIRSNKARHITATLFLLALTAVDLIFVVIYSMTGTIFDFSMFELTGDAAAITESLDIDFLFVAAAGMVVGAFAVFGRLPESRGAGESDGTGKIRIKKRVKAAVALIMAAAVGANAALGAVAVSGGPEDPYLTAKLYGRHMSSYADRGPIGNFNSELYRGLFRVEQPLSVSEIDSIVYSSTSSPSPRFGAARGYNVVTVLCESLEWFAFLADEERFPNGHKADELALRELYPNLYRFMDESVLATNFHSREKTDISENLSIMGSYPLYSYVNYDYPGNNVAYSLPNILKMLSGVESKSFHDNTGSFYNRNVYLTGALGFDRFVAAEEMAERGMTDYIAEGERNLDSEMIEICKEEMFPTSRRFNTYITTVTMHGQYAHRDNLEKYYARLDEKGILPQSGKTEEIPSDADILRYYAAAAMELDAALGVMLDYLDQTGLAENTLIVLFGDHNAYYQNLSNYVKDIDEQFNPADKNVTDLYRVPLMIRIGKGEEERTEIDKFTCTADILPTILDLLGIKYYDQLYFGDSIFKENESLLYSRAYDVFMTDRIYFSTLNDIRYKAKDVDEAYMTATERKGLALLKKIACTNAIFSRDFFTSARLTKFRGAMKQLNNTRS